MRFAALAAILFVSLPASVYGQAPSDQVPISYVTNMNLTRSTQTKLLRAAVFWEVARTLVC
jgi:hypothetical protein